MPKILLITITILLLSCKSAKKNTSDSSVLGDWTAVKKICCGRTSKITYFEKNQLILKLTKEKAQLLNGTEVISESNFDLQSFNDTSAIKNKITIGKDYPAIVSFKGDTLIVDYGYMDKETIYWLKK